MNTKDAVAAEEAEGRLSDLSQWDHVGEVTVAQVKLGSQEQSQQGCLGGRYCSHYPARFHHRTTICSSVKDTPGLSYQSPRD